MDARLTYSTWLSTFLTKRGLHTPDQRPLYQYQLTHVEYRSLTELLRLRKIVWESFDYKASCGCFVLFGAEWYRRKYESEWAWLPIYQMLGFALQPLEVARVVAKGLEDYWQRPLHRYESDRRDLLGSMFAEGGLPFRVLREGGNQFENLLRRSLNTYDQAELLGLSTVQHVGQLLAHFNLASVFSSVVSVELIGRMIDQLVALVRQYELDQSKEPTTDLDSQYPKWRETFPLPLDDETGRTLLNNLLRTASAERRKSNKHADIWHCEHLWQQERPTEFRTHISLPETLQFKLEVLPSTTRFELVVMEESTPVAKLGPAYAQIQDNMATLRPRRRDILVIRKNTNVPVNLTALTGGTIVASIPVPDSALAIGDTAICLRPVAEDENQWVVCGQASFSTTGQDLRVALPKQATWHVVEQDSEGSVQDSTDICSLSALRIKGKIHIEIGDDTLYRVRTGAGSNSTSGIELSGETVSWSTRPSPTFRGPPCASWSHAMGPPLTDGDATKKIFIAGQTLGTTPVVEQYGAHFVSVKNQDGDTLLRRKIGILPTDFKIELAGSDQPGRGAIRVRTSMPVVVRIHTNGVTTKVDKQVDGKSIQLTANGLPPARIQLAVTANVAADPILFDLPFPNFGSLAFDGKGNPLAQDICIDDLPGARVYLFGGLQRHAKFQIELSLKGVITRNAHFSWSYSAREEPVEVNLFNLKEQVNNLFSLNPHPDQTVELRIAGFGRDKYYRIHRYHSRATVSEQQGTVTLDGHNMDMSAPVLPQLMLLHDPQQKPIPLHGITTEGVATGRFELPAATDQDGPWLLVPSKESGISFRPQFVRGCWIQPETDGIPSTLQKAACMQMTDADESPFTSVLCSMADEPQHSGWMFLKALYDNYDYLPLPTFEVWKALVHLPNALAMALFRFEMSPQLISKLEAEFPLLWELLPARSVYHAGQRFEEFLQSIGVQADTAHVRVKRLLHKMGEILPSYGDEVQEYLLSGVARSTPIMAFRPVLDVWYSDLLRTHSDADWPTYGRNELEAWYASHHSETLTVDSSVRYRNPTLYFPMFAASVAAGNTDFESVFHDGADTIFFLRELRNFASEWFSPVYQYCLLANMSTQQASQA